MTASILLALGLFSWSVYAIAVKNDNSTLASRGLAPIFFDGWDFFSDADPIHGLVNFQTRENAKARQLINYLDNKAVNAVDDYTLIQQGHNCDSVRISSKEHYNAGTLIIADFALAPHGHRKEKLMS
ncbi:hypothetical protein C8R43DRAFT_1121565 [Mycena crocata]|nr:hypothetical protein C8R43DRAFT_1121565 [Mycena crocata]